MDLCGLELRSGYDYRQARRALDMLTLEWGNRGLNLWTIQSGTTTVPAGNPQLSLGDDGTDAIDLIEHFIRTGTGTNQNDQSLVRISVSQYSQIPSKLSTGKPVQIHILRQTAGLLVFLYPTPDQAYTLYWQKLRRIQDSGSPATNTMDLPFRFVPAITAGLAYYLALRKGLMDKIQLLKPYYEEQYGLAADEDRERASVYLVPRIC